MSRRWPVAPKLVALAVHQRLTWLDLVQPAVDSHVVNLQLWESH